MNICHFTEAQPLIDFMENHSNELINHTIEKNSPFVY